MKAEIEIDLGKLAGEWEPVAFRDVGKGENWLSPCGKEIRGASYADAANGPRLIVRRRWHFPKWITAAWYCEDERGQYVAEVEPVLQSGDCASWWNLTGDWRRVDGLTTCPRIGGDWRQSKRRNPRAK